MYAPIYWHIYTHIAEVGMINDVLLFVFLWLFFCIWYYGVKRENNSVVELYPGTICHIFFNLFILGSPSPSISVCHLSSAGSRGGRLLLHAWVWEEDSTPLLLLRHTWMTRFGLCLCEKHSRNGTSLSRSLSWGSGPSTPLTLSVCVDYLPVWHCVSVHVCVADPARWHELGLCVCQCSRMWNGSSLRDQNKAREHDRKSLNTRPLKNAGGQRTQKQVR